MSSFMINQQYKLLTMGDLYYSTNYDSAINLFTSLTSTNQVAVRAQLDALTFATVGHINKFAISTKLDNEKVIRVGNCSIGEIDRSAEKTPTISFEWLDVDNPAIFAKMLGLSTLSVAASPVSVTGEVMLATGSNTAGQTFQVAHTNGDGTVVSSIVVKNGAGTLTLHTDYEVILQNGVTSIVMITVNATTGIGLNVSYSYTPAASTMFGYNVQQESIPYGLYKFVSCPNRFSSAGSNNAIRDTIYFAKFALTGEMLEQYIDRVQEDFKGASMSFVGALGGMYLKVVETVTV